MAIKPFHQGNYGIGRWNRQHMSGKSFQGGVHDHREGRGGNRCCEMKSILKQRELAISQPNTGMKFGRRVLVETSSVASIHSYSSTYLRGPKSTETRGICADVFYPSLAIAAPVGPRAGPMGIPRLNTDQRLILPLTLLTIFTSPCSFFFTASSR